MEGMHKTTTGRKTQLRVFVDHTGTPLPRNHLPGGRTGIDQLRTLCVCLEADDFRRDALQIADPFAGLTAVRPDDVVPNNEKDSNPGKFELTYHIIIKIIRILLSVQ